MIHRTEPPLSPVWIHKAEVWSSNKKKHPVVFQFLLYSTKYKLAWKYI